MPRHLLLLGCPVVVLLAACSGGADPDPDPDPSGAAASAAAPSGGASVVAPPPYEPPSVAPSLPATDVDTVEQSREFVLTYFETLNYGYATGESDPLAAITSLSCFTCQQWIIEIATLEEEGLTRVGGSLLVSTIGTVGQTTNGDYQFRVVLDRLPGEITDATGENTRTFEASTEIIDVAVGLETSGITGNTTWTMSSVTPPAV